jgi:adenylyltransferase/sulfurtransferase
MGIVPGIIGLIQATETIKIITGIGQTLDKRLLVFDAMKMKFRELKLRPDPNSPTINQLIDYKEFCGLSKDASIDEEAGTVDNISVHDLDKLLNHKSQKICIIDVRTEQEYDLVHMNDTILIPLNTIESGESIPKIRELARENKLIVHCKLGGRSAKAIIAMKRFDIPAYNLAGGIDAWAKEIDPTMVRY